MNISGWFMKLFGALGRFLSVLFNAALKKELEVVMPIAAGAVRSVASDPTLFQPGMKREAALALIMAQLTKSQIEVGLSVVNLAIELAVQEFKATDAVTK